MEYRVENKYLVTQADLAVLAGRLRTVLPFDPHQKGDRYEIRSVYFDDAEDRCMAENEAGADEREKFRIRTYGPGSQVVHLEIKEKRRGMTKKRSCDLSRQEAERILDGAFPLAFDGRKELNLLHLQMRCSHLRPKALIAYERTAFVYPVGNVRITFDCNISASGFCRTFFDPRYPGAVPVLPAGIHILEVKYDELLPDFIAELLELRTLQQTAFSKYYLGRLAMAGQFPVL